MIIYYYCPCFVFIYYLPMRNWNIPFDFRYSTASSIYYLPMRNWNEYLYEIGYFLGISFTIYLWGIETIDMLDRNKQQYQFTIYLWGIETDEDTYNIVKTEYYLLFTYEELKLR